MTSIRADTDVCVGSGMCAFISEKYFAVGDDPPVVEVLQTVVDDPDRPIVDEAVESCPAQALALRDD